MTRRAFALLCAVAAALLGLSDVRAQPLPYRLDTVSAWGGAVNAFEKVGKLGYCGSGQRFVVLDMSNEANIQEIGSINLHSTVQDFAIRGTYAYVLCLENPNRFCVLDISIPSSPRLVWAETAARPNTTYASNIILYGNLAYLHYPAAATVWAYDLTNPAAPVAMVIAPPPIPGAWPQYDIFFGEVGTNAHTLPAVMEIVGDYAVTIGENLAPGGWYLSIFDLRPDPLHPTTLVGHVVLPGAAPSPYYHLAVSGGLAVAQIKKGFPDFKNVVRIVDISNPAQPVVRGSFDDVLMANGVAIQGNYAYVADWFYVTNTFRPLDSALNQLKGLAVLDISNPNNPVLVGTYNTTHSSIYDVRVSGTRAYLSCAGQGLEVLDVSNPAQPTRIGGFYSPGALRIMTKAGNRMYAVDEFNGFTILDVSNPEATPAVLGVYRTPLDYKHLGAWSVQLRDNLAYLAAGHGGVHVVNVANPAVPALVQQYTEVGGAFYVCGVELDGDILHATWVFAPVGNPNGYGVFANFAVSPSAPYVTKLGQANDVQVPSRLRTVQGITFSGNEPSLQRIENSNPTFPYVLANDLWGAADIEVVGNSLYTVDGPDNQLNILDVSDPRVVNLPLLGSYQGSGLKCVGVEGSRAFVSRWNIPGIAALNCSVPAASQVTAMSSLSHVHDIVAEDNLVYAVLADEVFGEANAKRGGLVIQRYICYADCDGEGGLTANDFQCFLNSYAAGLSKANCDGVGGLTANDFSCFLNAFVAGCH
jgi:hypothetical protein